MKRPEKAVLWLHVDKQKTEWFNHLGKPLYDHIVKLPSWVGLAYRPFTVRVEILENVPPFKDRFVDHDEWRPYVKENWMKKLTTMRKLNHGYIKVFTLAKNTPETRKLSIEEYNEYHRELRELNAKYGVGISTKSDSLRKDEK